MKFFIFIFLIFSMKTFAHHPGHKIEANEPYPSVTLEILEDNMDGYNLYIKLENFGFNIILEATAGARRIPAAGTIPPR